MVVPILSPVRRLEMNAGILLISLLLTQPRTFSHCVVASLFSLHLPASTYSV